MQPFSSSVWHFSNGVWQNILSTAVAVWVEDNSSESRLTVHCVFNGKRTALHRGITFPYLVMHWAPAPPSCVSHSSDVGGWPPFSQQSHLCMAVEQGRKDAPRHFGHATLTVSGVYKHDNLSYIHGYDTLVKPVLSTTTRILTTMLHGWPVRKVWPITHLSNCWLDNHNQQR